eukprot:TRINITY_DN16874_c0_g1_i2.p1 TRINITY_DN16874_c0_g1~~TRINITY_DN16874_c0_g1_i2.p1  ORF type:complete len:793 (+),score=205.20 TRINITY_DN16874_c0_g1_i2:137-2515(+)
MQAADPLAPAPAPCLRGPSGLLVVGPVRPPRRCSSAAALFRRRSPSPGVEGLPSAPANLPPPAVGPLPSRHRAATAGTDKHRGLRLDVLQLHPGSRPPAAGGFRGAFADAQQDNLGPSRALGGGSRPSRGRLESGAARGDAGAAAAASAEGGGLGTTIRLPASDFAGTGTDRMEEELLRALGEGAISAPPPAYSRPMTPLPRGPPSRSPSPLNRSRAGQEFVLEGTATGSAGRSRGSRSATLRLGKTVADFAFSGEEGDPMLRVVSLTRWLMERGLTATAPGGFFDGGFGHDFGGEDGHDFGRGTAQSLFVRGRYAGRGGGGDRRGMAERFVAEQIGKMVASGELSLDDIGHDLQIWQLQLLPRPARRRLTNLIFGHRRGGFNFDSGPSLKRKASTSEEVDKPKGSTYDPDALFGGGGGGGSGGGGGDRRGTKTAMGGHGRGGDSRHGGVGGKGFGLEADGPAAAGGAGPGGGAAGEEEDEEARRRREAEENERKQRRGGGAKVAGGSDDEEDDEEAKRRAAAEKAAREARDVPPKKAGNDDEARHRKRRDDAEDDDQGTEKPVQEIAVDDGAALGELFRVKFIEKAQADEAGLLPPEPVVPVLSAEEEAEAAEAAVQEQEAAAEAAARVPQLSLSKGLGGLAEEWRKAIAQAWAPYTDRFKEPGHRDAAADFAALLARAQKEAEEEQNAALLGGDFPSRRVSTAPGLGGLAEGLDLLGSPGEEGGSPFFRQNLRSQHGERYRRRLQARGDAALRQDRRWHHRVEACRRSLGSLSALGALGEDLAAGRQVTF